MKVAGEFKNSSSIRADRDGRNQSLLQMSLESNRNHTPQKQNDRFNRARSTDQGYMVLDQPNQTISNISSFRPAKPQIKDYNFLMARLK